VRETDDLSSPPAPSELRRSERGDARAPLPTTIGDRGWQRKVRGKHAIAAYVVLSIATLIVLRALIGELDFISIGWILVLAILPLLPWLLPRLGDFLKTVSPYVQSVKLGGLQIDLRAVRREAIVVPSTGAFADVANDVAALSSGTTISAIMSSLLDLRRKGGSPVGIIDLKDGRKWRLPNLYFVARLLETDPLVSQLVFTEMQAGRDGYVIGSCRPDELRRQVEQAMPSYAEASSTISVPAGRDLANVADAQDVATEFIALLDALPASPPEADDDPLRGWVTAERLRTILGGLLSTAAIEATSDTLSEQDVRTIVASRHRFLPATVDGFITGLIDREAVALSVARATVAQA
jgi:hypothetical protein